MHETIYEKNFKSLLLQAALSAIIFGEMIYQFTQSKSDLK